MFLGFVEAQSDIGVIRVVVRSENCPWAPSASVAPSLTALDGVPLTTAIVGKDRGWNELLWATAAAISKNQIATRIEKPLLMAACEFRRRSCKERNSGTRYEFPPGLQRPQPGDGC